MKVVGKTVAKRAAIASFARSNVVRSYVMQPYQLAKDLRTGVEARDVNSVLDGDIDKFLVAALAENSRGTSSRPLPTYVKTPSPR